MNSHELSEAESFGFFSESDDYWNRRKRVHRNQLQRERDADVVTALAKINIDMSLFDHGYVWWQYYFEPSFGCPFEERIGAVGKLRSARGSISHVSVYNTDTTRLSRLFNGDSICVFNATSMPFVLF